MHVWHLSLKTFLRSLFVDVPLRSKVSFHRWPLEYATEASWKNMESFKKKDQKCTNTFR